MTALTLTLSDRIASCRRAIASTAASRSAAMRKRAMALWIGDDGDLRLGRSGDVTAMMDDLGIRTRA